MDSMTPIGKVNIVSLQFVKVYISQHVYTVCLKQIRKLSL